MKKMLLLITVLLGAQNGMAITLSELHECGQRVINTVHDRKHFEGVEILKQKLRNERVMVFEVVPMVRYNGYLEYKNDLKECFLMNAQCEILDRKYSRGIVACE